MATTRRKIALLRGINLGSRNRVGMGDLRELLTEAGYADVRTLLQSGNVVLTTGIAAARLERELAKHIGKAFAIEIEVIVRTRDQLANVIERDPLGKVAKNPSRYLVNFLSAKPKAKVVRELSAVDVAPERFELVGRELYAWHPDGVQRSRLNKLVVANLGVSATARNWNTVLKLLELADE